MVLFIKLEANGFAMACTGLKVCGPVTATPLAKEASCVCHGLLEEETPYLLISSALARRTNLISCQQQCFIPSEKLATQARPECTSHQMTAPCLHVKSLHRGSLRWKQRHDLQATKLLGEVIHKGLLPLPAGEAQGEDLPELISKLKEMHQSNEEGNGQAAKAALAILLQC